MRALRAGCTLLLIDDEQTALHLRQRVLQNSGFTVLTAANAEEGLELFRHRDIDIVITDHLLGRSTAASMSSEMKRLKPDVPIISLSGTTNVEEALKYADEFVSKVDGPEPLLKVLDRHIGERSCASQPSSRPGDAPDMFTLQALLAAIVKDSRDAILSKTLDGTVTSWNHAAEEIYGYTREEMIGRPVATLLPPDRPDEVNQILARLRRGEHISHFETVRVAKNGRRIDVALTISPIRDGSGRLVGASTIARDITEKKGAEEALRKSEKLALAGRMATTIAHEINNPLEAIGNILYLLRHAVELNAEALSYVQTAQDELKRVSEIVKLTLGLQRTSEDTREPVRPTALIDNLLTIYQKKVQSVGARVVKSYRCDEPVLANAGELRQVFSNLVVNAADALAVAGDKLVIGVRKARRWDTGETGIRISIADNATGIAPEHRGRLFQAFYTTKGEQGTGIGLWMSRNIVQKYGGTMRFHTCSLPGASGTCVSVFLPLAPPRG